MNKLRFLSVLLSTVVTLPLLVGNLSAAEVGVHNVNFTTANAPTAVEETPVEEPEGTPVICDFSSLATAFKYGGPSHTTDNSAGDRGFVKLDDGTEAMQLKYSPYEKGGLDNYRVMFSVTKGVITDEHKYMRVTYMTTETAPMVASVISKPGQQKVIAEYDTAENAGKWTRTIAADISKNGIQDRLKSGASIVVQFSGTSPESLVYIKEIAFFTSYKQAYTYYGEEASLNANDFYTMTFGDGSNGIVRDEDPIWGNNEVDANGILHIRYAEKTNMPTNYMAKVKFNTKNALPDHYAYVRVLYSAKNPEGTSDATMYIQCDGGKSVLPIDKNINDTNGRFVLSSVGLMETDIMGRLAATNANKANQHVSLCVNAAKDGGEYSIKAIYFFPSQEAAESFKLDDSKYFVKINGNDISKYQIVIAHDAAPIIERAAMEISKYVFSVTGEEIPVVTDKAPESAYEILVGTSSRAKSTEILSKYDFSGDNYRMYVTELMGDTLVLNGAEAYAVLDAVEAILDGYLYKGLSQIPKKLEIPAPAVNVGLSGNMKAKGEMRLHTNVEQPAVFTEDFDIDGGYFTEENNTSFFQYKNGEYTVDAGDVRRLSYVHVYEANVDYTAKLEYTTAGADGDMGLMLRYVASDAYAKAGYDFAKGEWYIEYREGEDFYIHRIASAKTAIAPNNKYTLRFVVDGTSAILYVDGVQVIATSDMNHVTPGRIAVYAENASISVDDVNVVLLSGMGTVMKDINHFNLEEVVDTNGASFIELSDGSIYIHIPNYSTPYISKDNGKTWEKTADILGIGKSYAHPLVLLNGDLLQIKLDGNNIAAYTSKNDGKTWTRTGTVCPLKDADGFQVSNMNDKVMQFPGNGRIVYAASANANGGTAHISKYYYSDDNGATWKDFGFTNQDIEGLKGIDRFAESKMIECSDGFLRVYTTWGGVHGCLHYFESTDGGMTWGPNVLIPEMYAPSSSYQIVRDPYGETEHTYYMVWVYAVPESKGDEPSIANRSRLALAKTVDGKNWEYLGDIWCWESAYSHHGVADLNQIVNPSIGISEDALLISTGISERLRPDGDKTTHGDQQNHLWVIERDSIPEGKPMNEYADVKIGAKYYEAVSFVSEKGLFTGTAANTFDPDTFMTRAMFVTVLGRLDGADVSGYTKPTFSDVIAGQWYTSYVEWAASNKIVNGLGNGLFGINDTLTVEQACVMLARYAENKTAATQSGKTAASYADASAVSAWAKDGVEWAIANGIYDGQNGAINPTAYATRALVATMFYNFVNVFGE